VLSFYFFACQGKSADPQFDARRAWQHLVKQVQFGARYPGGAGHDACRDYLVRTLRMYTDRVRVQSFMAVNYLLNQRVRADNIIATFGRGPFKLLLCAHWDNRPLADQDPHPANRKRPVPGANDGASGVAVLLEIARNLSRMQLNSTIQIVLFDAEDLGHPSKDHEFLQGSRFFARNLPLKPRPQMAILLDMVGDKDLQIYVEQNSQAYAPNLVEQVWNVAAQLGVSQFVPEARYMVTDDHLPLLQAGIPAIDVIDFDYPYWHTVDDTPDKCSPQSLKAVGDVVLEFVRRHAQ
jgi:Zn-dependent M28 family amino/carboxypeptidase